jgi:thiosulfate reductase cytochrome b subunit
MSGGAALPVNHDDASDGGPGSTGEGHRLWVRLCHWTMAAGFLLLAFTGVMILAVHPRLYWGEVGNDLVPALVEFPLSRNSRPADYGTATLFANVPGAPVTATRDYEHEYFFNNNSWGRSLHFLAAWILFGSGLVYVLAAVATGHARRDLLPRLRELSTAALWRDFRKHLQATRDSAAAGPPYGLLQKLSYAAVVFVALPLMLLTGLTMAPAVTAGYPVLLDVFGGYQSARTIHFVCFALLFLFLVTHVAMVVATGFRRQLRGMILGQ